MIGEPINSPICVVRGCQKFRLRGWPKRSPGQGQPEMCKRHYYRALRFGDPLVEWLRIPELIPYRRLVASFGPREVTQEQIAALKKLMDPEATITGHRNEQERQAFRRVMRAWSLKLHPADEAKVFTALWRELLAVACATTEQEARFRKAERHMYVHAILRSAPGYRKGINIAKAGGGTIRLMVERWGEEAGHVAVPLRLQAEQILQAKIEAERAAEKRRIAEERARAEARRGKRPLLKVVIAFHDYYPSSGYVSLLPKSVSEVFLDCETGEEVTDATPEEIAQAKVRHEKKLASPPPTEERDSQKEAWAVLRYFRNSKWGHAGTAEPSVMRPRDNPWIYR